MKPTQKSFKPHITRWVQDDLITQDQANTILSKYPADSTSPATTTFSIIGGLLCILGVILLYSIVVPEVDRSSGQKGFWQVCTDRTISGPLSDSRRLVGVRSSQRPGIPPTTLLNRVTPPDSRRLA